MSYEPTDEERYPTLTEAGRSLLTTLREHPSAPIFRNQSGNRLTADDVQRVRRFESEVLSADVPFGPTKTPDWLESFVARCFAEVPFYRSQGERRTRLVDIEPVGRADLSRDIAAFVPDSAPASRLINFRTSGTTGHPLLIASHPVVAASYLAFHKRALARFGIALTHGRGQVGVVLLGFQRRCFTYVSVTPTMDESGLVKLNLHPDDWHRREDRARYLEALAPEIIAGDPLSFAELLEVAPSVRPRALVSTSMALLSGLRSELEARFECPVLDVYSLNEAGPVAVWEPGARAHVLLQHRLFVEILDPLGDPVPLGARGEITLTGGFNFCLPLLRYRTGDFASLAFVRGEPALLELEGRPPVRFRTQHGEWLNNIELTHALRDLPLRQYRLHQRADGVLRLELADAASLGATTLTVLRQLFGAAQPIDVVELVVGEDQDKIVQYTSDMSATSS